MKGVYKEILSESELPEVNPEVESELPIAVSFDNSGQTDIIDHQINGYLAEYKNAEDLATGIEWVLENTEKLGLSDACVKKVEENYSEAVIAKKYISLYTDLINDNKET